MHRFLIVLLLATLYLTACSTLPSGPDKQVSLPAQIEKLAALEQWRVTGKIAIRQGKQATSATLVWQQDGLKTDFSLTNMLGLTLAQLYIDKDGATIEADGKTLTDRDADMLIEQVTGLRIPVKKLTRWVKGVPFEDEQYQLNDKGLLLTLEPNCAECGLWQVNYDNYGEVNYDGISVWLPHSITLLNPHHSDRFIRIRISQWTIN